MTCCPGETLRTHFRCYMNLIVLIRYLLGLIGGIILFSPSSAGQEMLGAVQGNYSGTQVLQLNPSALHQSKTWLDIHLLGADFFLQNNFLYQDKNDYRFSNFFKADYIWPTHLEQYGTEERIFYYYENNRNKKLLLNLRINGPGALVALGKHAFALTTVIRTSLSMRRVPYELAKFLYLGLNYRPQQNIRYTDNKPITASMMTWAEIGLSYAYVFHARGLNKWSAGITFKLLEAYTGAYIRVRQLDYIVLNDSTLNVLNLDATTGMALPISYDQNSFWNDKFFKGSGIGVDLGVTFTRLKKNYQTQIISRLCAQRYDDYLYRIGVSLIDIGAVKFKYNARKYLIDNCPSYWENVNRLDFQNLGHLFDTISYRCYGDSTAALVSDRFSVWLPSAISVQADYHLYRNWYINAIMVYGFTLSGASLSRPTQLAITPRYESRWLEVSVPISLYDWYLPRIGLAVRVFGFTVGTDKLGGFFHMSNFTGLDFYFSLRFFLEKGICRSKGIKGCLRDQKLNVRKLKF